MANNFTVIEGPPGTGKTQTILNLIANLIIRNKNALIVASNNSATQNICEKLESKKFGFLIANLGNSENVSSFFQRDFCNEIEDFCRMVENSNLKNKEQITSKELKKLEGLFKIERSCANEKQMHRDYLKEQEHFKKLHSDCDFSIYSNNLQSFKIEKIMKFISWLKKNKISYFQKWRIRKVFKIKRSKMKDFLPYASLFLQDKYYSLKIEICDKNIKEYQKKLKNSNHINLLDEYSEKSLLYFSNFLNNSLKQFKSKNFNKDSYRGEMSSFVKRFPIVTSTVHSSFRTKNKDFIYDYVIFDESSQIDLLSGSLSLLSGQNAVVVGNSKQLEQIENLDKKTCVETAEKFKISSAYQYHNNSLLKSVKNAMPKIPTTMLVEHYRCHPLIINFCNRMFYDNKLVIMSKNKNDDFPMYIIHTGEGKWSNKSKDGWVNRREVETIINEILENDFFGIEQESIGIITPFRAQANEIKKRVSKEKAKIDTVHKFQGRECSSVIISTVLDELNPGTGRFNQDFVNKKELINVAISRAVEKLFLVISEGIFKSQNNHIKDLISYVNYYDSSKIIKGQTTSVFDAFYKDYNSFLQSYKARQNTFDSKHEMIYFDLLNNELKNEKYSRFSISIHQRLSEVIKNANLEKYDQREINFFKNEYSHIDFTIYDSLTKKFLLAIEIDGMQHENDDKQKWRDSIKDKILNDHNIAVLRVSTRGSNEKEKLLKSLDRLIH